MISFSDTCIAEYMEGFVANCLAGELGPPRNRLGVNRWPSREQMVATAPGTKMKKKITWSSNHSRPVAFFPFLAVSFIRTYSVHVTQTNAHDDFHVYNTIYPPYTMTNGYNRNNSNLTNTMEHANALIQRGPMSRNKTERMERVYWPPGKHWCRARPGLSSSKTVYRKASCRQASVTVLISYSALALLHHLPPRRQDHIIPTLLQYPLALFLILRPGGLGRRFGL